MYFGNIECTNTSKFFLLSKLIKKFLYNLMSLIEDKAILPIDTKMLKLFHFFHYKHLCSISFKTYTFVLNFLRNCSIIN